MANSASSDKPDVLAEREAQHAAILRQAQAAHGRSAAVTERANEPLIPFGSTIFVRHADVGRVKRGRFVFVHHGGRLMVRRLIRRLVTTKGLLMVVATASGQTEPPLSGDHLLGEVVEVLAPSGRRFDPATVGHPFQHWITDWNTCSPGRKLGRLLLAALSPRARSEG